MELNGNGINNTIGRREYETTITTKMHYSTTTSRSAVYQAQEDASKAFVEIIIGREGRFYRSANIEFHGNLHRTTERIKIERSVALKAYKNKYAAKKKKGAHYPYNIIINHLSYVDTRWGVF